MRELNLPGRTSDDGGSPRRRSPVVVGLGNPGRKYERTRHNAGFMVADELARRYGGSWRTKKRAEIAEIGLDLKNVTLIKPQTMMNNSGAVLTGYAAEDLIVVHDELDIPPGEVRVKVSGGHGGHNGLRSISNLVGRDFVRVRVGIGRPPEGMDVVDYVLGGMDRVIRDAIPEAADAVEKILADGPDRAMDIFNRRS